MPLPMGFNIPSCAICRYLKKREGDVCECSNVLAIKKFGATHSHSMCCVHFSHWPEILVYDQGPIDSEKERRLYEKFHKLGIFHGSVNDKLNEPYKNAKWTSLI